MMFPTLGFTALISTVAVAYAELSTGRPYSLCWGASSVTASRFTSNGAFQVVTFPTSKEYQGLLDDAVVHYDPMVREDKLDEGYVTAIFRETVQRASEHLQASDSEDPNYAMFSLPSVFNHSFSLIAQDTMLPVAKDANKLVMACTLPLASTAGFAYNLHKCEQVGRTPKECHDKLEGFNDKALVIEYEKQYLGLHVIELGYETSLLPPLGKIISSRFGENNADAFRTVCPPLRFHSDS